MQSFTLIVTLALVAAAYALPSDPKPRYTDRYDNVNLDEILANKRLLEPYLHCILDKGRCSPDGKELKSHIREALENHCDKCTDPQRTGTMKVLKHVINHEPDYWNQLVNKYDKDRKYVERYEKELKTLKA